GRMADALAAAHRRWATGVFAFWYPVKDWREIERFCRTVPAIAVPKTRRLEGSVDMDGDAGKLNGTGMIVVNPPWKLLDEARRMLPWLAAALATGKRHGWKAEWLVGE
ncbi:MAG: 23S rRNA (adenine(2030)-N(6))-methyltransferase RlmJ, partial [Beijerinckiaceae bacterium]